jgi:hypothetical protein
VDVLAAKARNLIKRQQMKITRQRNEDAYNALYDMVDREAIQIIYEAYLQEFLKASMIEQQQVDSKPDV